MINNHDGVHKQILNGNVTYNFMKYQHCTFTRELELLPNSTGYVEIGFGNNVLINNEKIDAQGIG